MESVMQLPADALCAVFLGLVLVLFVIIYLACLVFSRENTEK